ncbi:MAG: hypothetical protein V7784_02090, partial [Oceanospirillaceae bacterium]
MTFNAELMDNGETRLRFASADASVYIRTIAGEHGSWQNSHYHKTLQETYIVQEGWIAVAEIINEKMHLRIERQNSVFTSQPNIPHNLYLPSGAVIHTVKHGRVTPGDWYSSQALDELTKKLSEKMIISISKEA